MVEQSRGNQEILHPSRSRSKWPFCSRIVKGVSPNQLTGRVLKVERKGIGEEKVVEA